jgi:heptaprenyl diphosphate synthase
MAFQIIDDLLDYSGEDSVVGKETLADLANGYFTLPVIYALQSSEHSDLEQILSVTSHEEKDVLKAIDLIKSSNGIERAGALAEKYTKRAIKHVHELPDNRGKDILLELIPMMLRRNK